MKRVEIIECSYTLARHTKVRERPVEEPDGKRRVFSTTYRYKGKTLEVWRNGLYMFEGKGNDFVENPDRKSFTFITEYPPAKGDIIQVKYIRE